MGCVVNSTPWPAFSLGKRPGIHCTGGWVGTRALDGWENLPPPGFDPRTVQTAANR